MNEDEKKIADELFEAIKSSDNKSQSILDYKNFIDAVIKKASYNAAISASVETI